MRTRFSQRGMVGHERQIRGPPPEPERGVELVAVKELPAEGARGVRV
ncbi:MAG TPA: hypothetical protein VNA28_06345 [Solirubrobacteraceae bacterium]|nr:hypothetical protein [Solirubrobacteraceae bacterium]